MRPVAAQNRKRRVLKDALRKNETRDAAFQRIIRSVPKGKVSTYGKVPLQQAIRSTTGQSHACCAKRRFKDYLGSAS
jgi:alkylated DNA nucleotide flippase Atl1